MARTRFGSRIREAIRIAARAQRQGWSDSRVREYVDELESRRKFLAGLAAMTAAPLLGCSSLTPPFAAGNDANKDGVPKTGGATASILILGAGGAGLAAGYALQKAGVSFQIVEANTRVGGRILTMLNYNGQGQFIEAGAELMDTDHTTLIGLARQLGVPVQQIYNAHEDPELFLVGGQFYTFSDLVANIRPFITGINNAIDNGASFLNYDQYANNAAALAYDNMSAAEFLQSLQGSVDHFVLAVIGARNVAEFGLDLDQMSSINLIFDSETSVSEFRQVPASSEALRVMGGSSQITNGLAAAISADHFKMGTRVVAIKKSGSNLVVTVQEGAKTTDITAAQVINTLPFSTLRNVDGLSQLGISAAKLSCINNIGMGTNSKVIMEFTQKPWLRAGTAPASAGTIFSDLPSISFWDAGRGQTGTNGLVVNYTGGVAGARVNSATAITQALPDLSQLYPSLAGKLVSSFAANWSQAPNALGSYACLKTGQFQQFSGAQGTAELDGQLLFAGEACDPDFNGFMEGAYRSGITAANTILSSQGHPLFVADSGAGRTEY